MVLDPELQEDVQREMRSIQNADRVKVFENEVETEVLDDLHGRGSARNFTFEYDEPEYVAGGQGRAPRPLEYFLAGFAFCQQVQYARNALATGIEFGDLRMNVKGLVDPRGSLMEGGVPAGFDDDEIQFTTHIQSEAPRNEVRELVRTAENRCHAHASLTREMTLTREILLNGEPLEV